MKKFIVLYDGDYSVHCNTIEAETPDIAIINQLEKDYGVSWAKTSDFDTVMYALRSYKAIEMVGEPTPATQELVDTLKAKRNSYIEDGIKSKELEELARLKKKYEKTV